MGQMLSALRAANEAARERREAAEAALQEAVKSACGSYPPRIGATVAGLVATCAPAQLDAIAQLVAFAVDMSAEVTRHTTELDAAAARVQ